MGLSAVLTVPTDDFNKWIGGTPIAPVPATPPKWIGPFETAITSAVAHVESISDPAKRVAMAALLMGTVQGKLVETESTSIEALNDHTRLVSDLLNQMNDTVASNKLQGDTEMCSVATGPTEQGMKDLKLNFINNGTPAFDTGSPFLNTAINKWQLNMKKSDVTTAVESLTQKLDAIKSTSQQAQLNLETLMDRVDGVIEVCSAAFERDAKQAATATGAYRK
jgi:hypothetical protein